MIHHLTKEQCPICGTDGKAWEWNTRGGQSYTACKHIVDTDSYKHEAKLLIKEIAHINNRLQEIKETLASCSKQTKEG